MRSMSSGFVYLQGVLVVRCVIRDSVCRMSFRHNRIHVRCHVEGDECNRNELGMYLVWPSK